MKLFLVPLFYTLKNKYSLVVCHSQMMEGNVNILVISSKQNRFPQSQLLSLDMSR